MSNGNVVQTALKRCPALKKQVSDSIIIWWKLHTLSTNSFCSGYYENNHFFNRECLFNAAPNFRIRSPGDEKEGNEIFMSLVSGQVAKQDLKWRHSSLIYVEDRFR